MAISIDISEEAGVRYLHFGSSWIQGAMRIRRPWSLELDYTRDMMAALLLREPLRWPARALLIGLGAASLAKFLYRNFPRTRLRVVEIEPAVIAAARHFFKLPDDPRRLDIIVGDGDDYLARQERGVDLLLVDGFDADGRAGALDTLRFYQRSRAHLTERGLMVVNLLGRSRAFRASIERMRAAFDGRVLALPSCPGGNVVVFAAVGDSIVLDLPELRERARRLRQASGLDVAPMLARIAAARRGRAPAVVL